MSVKALEDLIHHIEDGASKSMELDSRIAVTVFFPEYSFPDKIFDKPPCSWFGAHTHLTLKEGDARPPLKFTSSIDASTHLSHLDWPSMLIATPGYDYGVYQAPWKCQIEHKVSSGGGPKVVAYAKSELLARVLAWLKVHLWERSNAFEPPTVNNEVT